MKRKYATAAIFAVAAIGFTYVSPYIAMYRLSMAAKSVRLSTLAERADLPTVRASVQRQLLAAGETSDTEELKEMLDTIVSPPGLTTLILHGKLGPDGERHDFRLAYHSWDYVVLRRAGAGKSATSFLLQRHGVWDWRLVDLSLPAELL